MNTQTLSNMNILTPQDNTKHIYDLVGLCANYGVKKAVLCPGSRCAPLLIGFGKHPDIETISVTDERSAGFIGLGIAQQSGKPVVLVCTSGTAAQNFAPAVTEAFYQNVPLIVLTADRPTKWIDQWDGQTIHQEKLYAPHVKSSFVYDKETDDAGEKALALALDWAKGPVHLNIPIEEPFYPSSLNEIRIATKGHAYIAFRQTNTKFAQEKKYEIDKSIWAELKSELNRAKKVMILGGQGEPNSELVDLLSRLDAPMIGDVISNLHSANGVIKSADLIFKTGEERLMVSKGHAYTSLRQTSTEFTKNSERFKPDFLITLGRSIMSKNLKLYLRKHKPKVHWHIGLGMVGDPFQSLTKKVRVSPVQFFKEWRDRKIKVNDQSKYQRALADIQKLVDEDLRLKLDDAEFNYFSAAQKLISELPENSVLHLGNSMPVRIANFIGMKDSTVDVWCNRGTSGIDGVVSTAVGHALAETERMHTLIIGDLSFFYDRNGLWLNHKFPQNLRIVVLNDSGGGIFNMISGPSNQGDLTELFTTPHNRTAELTAKEFNMAYWRAGSMDELGEVIKDFQPGILDVFTDMNTNTEVFKRIATIVT